MPVQKATFSFLCVGVFLSIGVVGNVSYLEVETSQ